MADFALNGGTPAATCETARRVEADVAMTLVK
jgi:hypothetical protein